VSTTRTAVVATVNENPVIAGQPTSSQNVCSGVAATLSVTATGPGLTYQWKKNGSNVTDGTGGTTNSYTTSTSTPNGTYSVVVTTDSGCVATSADAVVAVWVSPVIDVQPAPTTVICAGATAALSVTATGTNLTYQWKKDGVDVTGGTGGTTKDYTTPALTASAVYTVAVTNNNGCTVISNNAQVTVNPLPVIIGQPDATAICAGSTAMLSVTATGSSLSYQWQKNNVDINGATSSSYTTETLAATTTYRVKVTNSYNCSIFSDNAQVTVSPLPVFTGASANPVTICQGASSTLTATATGATEYSFDGGGTWQTGNTLVVSPTITTDYTVKVRLSAACEAVNTETVTVTVSGVQPAFTGVAASLPTICQGGSTTLTATATGAAQYSFDNGSTWQGNSTKSVTPGTTTTYTVKVRSDEGCEAPSKDVTVTVNPLPTFSNLTTSHPTICAGSGTNVTLTATATGAAEYSFDNGSSWQASNTFTVSPTGNTTYTVKVRSAAGCEASASKQVAVNVEARPTFDSNPTASLPTICQGGSTTLTATATGAAQYSFDNGSTWQAGSTKSVTPSTTTTYTVKLRSALGCEATETRTVGVTVSKPSITATPGSSTVCSGGTTTLTGNASGGTAPYQYRLNSGNYQSPNSFSSVGAGTYTITVKDYYGCETTSSSVSISASSPSVSINPSSPSVCYGGNVQVTASGSGGSGYGYRYSLDGGNYGTSSSFSVGAGSHTIYVRDDNYCEGSTSFSVATSSPSVSISPSSPSACSGGNVTVTATPSGGTSPYQYSLTGSNYGNPGSSYGFNAAAGNSYTVYVKDANGCTASTSFTVANSSSLSVSLSPSSSSVCSGTTTISASASGGSSPYQYKLSNGDNSSSGSFSVGAGSYTVTVTDANGCTATSNTATVTIASISAYLTSSAVCTGNTATLYASASGGSGNYEYKLGDGTYQGSGTFSGLGDGSYTVTARDKTLGCTATSGGTVTVYSKPTVSTTGASSCGSGSVTLYASSSNVSGSPDNPPTLEWYSSEGGSEIGSGGSYYISNLTQTTTYYVKARLGTSGCESGYVPVTATLSNLSAPSVSNRTACANTSVCLSASVGSDLHLIWYNSGGSEIYHDHAMGYCYYPTTAGVTTFYVAAYDPNTGCTSARASLTVTISNCP
jgi:hypothetical protein